MSALRFRLVAKKCACIVKGNQWIRDEERYASLPAAPPAMVDIESSYAVVAHKAVELNKSQLKSNFIDYLYYPDPVKDGKK